MDTSDRYLGSRVPPCHGRALRLRLLSSRPPVGQVQRWDQRHRDGSLVLPQPIRDLKLTTAEGAHRLSVQPGGALHPRQDEPCSISKRDSGSRFSCDGTSGLSEVVLYDDRKPSRSVALAKPCGQRTVWSPYLDTDVAPGWLGPNRRVEFPAWIRDPKLMGTKWLESTKKWYASPQRADRLPASRDYFLAREVIVVAHAPHVAGEHEIERAMP